MSAGSSEFGIRSSELSAQEVVLRAQGTGDEF